MGVGTWVPKLQPRGVGREDVCVTAGTRLHLPAVLGRPCELRTIFRFLKNWGDPKKITILRHVKIARSHMSGTINGIVLEHFTLVCLLIVCGCASLSLLLRARQ